MFRVVAAIDFKNEMKLEQRRRQEEKIVRNDNQLRF